NRGPHRNRVITVRHWLLTYGEGCTWRVPVQLDDHSDIVIRCERHIIRNCGYIICARETRIDSVDPKPAVFVETDSNNIDAPIFHCRDTGLREWTVGYTRVIYALVFCTILIRT